MQAFDHVDGPDLPRLMVVDDVDANLVALDALLEGLPCTIEHARSGRQALQLLLQREFAAMLLDVQMPLMDGFEVARLARGTSLGRDLPIIFLTAAESSDEFSRRGYDSGAVDFLFKPLNRSVLRSKVSVFLELYSSRRRLAQTVALLEKTNARLFQLAREEAAATERLRAQHEELQQAHGTMRSLQARLVHAARVEAVGELIAGISYEINDPLAFATSHVSTVDSLLAQLDEVVSPLLGEGYRSQWKKARSRLGDAAAGLERIDRVLNKLRLITAPDEHGPRRVPVRDCVDAALAVVRQRVSGVLTVEVEISHDDQLDSSPGLLCQLILKLLSEVMDSLDGRGIVTIAGAHEEQGYVLSLLASDAPPVSRDAPVEGRAGATAAPHQTDESIAGAIAEKLGASLSTRHDGQGRASAWLTFPRAAVRSSDIELTGLETDGARLAMHRS